MRGWVKPISKKAPLWKLIVAYGQKLHESSANALRRVVKYSRHKQVSFRTALEELLDVE